MTDITLFVSLPVASLVALYCLLRYVGILGKVDVTVGSPILSNVWIAYKLCKGPYEQCGPHFDRIISDFPGDPDCIGIYFDDPKRVSKENLRYIVAAILSSSSEGNDQGPSPSLIDHMQKNGYEIAELPNVESCVKARYPFYFTMLAGLGAMRVYPALEKFSKENKLNPYPFLEMYIGKMIHYMGPLNNQELFMDLAK